MFKNLLLVFILSCFIMSSGYIYLDKVLEVKDTGTEVLYVRAFAVSARPVLGHLEITKKALGEYYKSFEGVNIMLGHEKGDPNLCIGRVLKASVKHDRDRKVDYIEIIFKVFTQDAINKIKTGQYYYLSVGMQDIESDHPALTGGTRIITEFTGDEVSFVGSPRDKYARVLEFSEKLEEVLE